VLNERLIRAEERVPADGTGNCADNTWPVRPQSPYESSSYVQRFPRDAETGSVFFASSTDHRRLVASRRAGDGLHGSFNPSRAGVEGGWATLTASRRQRRELMKKDFSPTKRQEEHEKPTSSILLASTA